MSILPRLACFLAPLWGAMQAHAERVDFDAGPNSSTPSLAVDPARGLVLTWQSRKGQEASLNFALLSAQGRELRRGVIATGSDWFVNWADFPSLTVLDNNDWVTYWLQKSAPDTYAYDLRVLRSSNGGGRWSEALTPHDDGTPTEHGFASMVALGDSRVQLLWLDGRHSRGAADDHHEGHADEGPMTLRGATLDWRGRILAPVELDARTCSCCQTDVARIGDRALVVYRDRSEDETRDIQLVERASDGSWSAPERVHADNWKIAACPVNGPAIAASGERALVVWPTQVNDALAVRYRVRIGDNWSPMQTLEQTPQTLGRVDVAADANGGFAVSWVGAGSQGATALKLARVDADGKLLKTREIAVLEPGRSTGHPRLAWYRDVHYLTWTESGGPGNTRIALERIDR